jgi:hypothetical protein
LLEPQDAGSAAWVQPDYRIKLVNHGRASTGNQFRGEMQAETLGSDGTLRGTLHGSYVSDATPRCATTSPANAMDAAIAVCADPRGVAASLVSRLRTMVFPPDPSVRRGLQARLLNLSLDAGQRLQALSELASMGRGVPDGARGTAALEALRDPAVVRGAVDLGTTAADPMHRTQVWVTMLGVGNVELVRPLLRALRQDGDGEVRLAALGTLAADFREDARVRQAFEMAAQRDARSLIRALAQRALGGSGAELAWRNHVIASLEDTRRPTVERIEALCYQMGLSTISMFRSGEPPSSPGSVLRLLDDAAIRALVEVLPDAAARLPAVPPAVATLAKELGRIDHPAITDMLLASLDGGSQWLNHDIAVQALAALPGRRQNLRVRTALERIGASDPDPRVREAAVVLLQNESPQPSAVASNGAGQPRLGVTVRAIDGPDLQKELVGKPMVARVGPGTTAEKAGVLEGDIVLEINGTPVPSPSDLPRIVESVPRGVDVDVVVYRFGGSVTLKARF